MVWDVSVDVTEHLAKPACTLDSLHLNDMFPREDTSIPLETELFFKTNNYIWKSVVSLLNILAMKKDIK